MIMRYVITKKRIQRNNGKNKGFINQNKTKSKATGTPPVAFPVIAIKTNGFPRKQKKTQ